MVILESNHLVDVLLSTAFCGSSPTGLLPPGLVATTDPFQDTTALLFRTLNSAACTNPSGVVERIAVMVHLIYRYVTSVVHMSDVTEGVTVTLGVTDGVCVIDGVCVTDGVRVILGV